MLTSKLEEDVKTLDKEQKRIAMEINGPCDLAMSKHQNSLMEVEAGKEEKIQAKEDGATVKADILETEQQIKKAERQIEEAERQRAKAEHRHNKSQDIIYKAEEKAKNWKKIIKHYSINQEPLGVNGEK